MVAYRAGIITHSIHQFYLNSTFEGIIVERTLRKVAAIEKQEIILAKRVAQFLNQQCTVHYTSITVLLGLNAAVSIVGMQYRNLLLRSCATAQYECNYKKHLSHGASFFNRYTAVAFGAQWFALGCKSLYVFASPFILWDIIIIASWMASSKLVLCDTESS